VTAAVRGTKIYIFEQGSGDKIQLSACNSMHSTDPPGSVESDSAIREWRSGGGGHAGTENLHDLAKAILL